MINDNGVSKLIIKEMIIHALNVLLINDGYMIWNK
jgi:hypothetical protein